MEIKILCFLQNQWFKNADHYRALIARRGEQFRRDLIRRALFYRCLTGRRIKTCFGEDLVAKMQFDETTREIADNPQQIFSPDLGHMAGVVEYHQPKVILTFGKIASDALTQLLYKYELNQSVYIIRSVHPAARGPDTISKLKSAAESVREMIKTHETLQT